MVSAVTYLNLFSAIYYVVLIGYIAYNRTKFVGSASLLLLMIANTYILINNSFVLSGYIIKYPIIFWLTFIIVTPFPVFFKWHINTLIQKRIRFDITSSLVLVLWAFGTYSAIRFYQNPMEERLQFINSIINREFPDVFVLLNAMFYLVVLIIFVETGFTVWKKPKLKSKAYDNLYVQSNKYVRQFWTLNVGMYIVVMLLYFLIPEFYIEFLAIPVSLSLLFLFLVINLRHYALTYGFQSKKNNLKSGNEISRNLLLQIENTIGESKHFTQPDFNLDKVAEILNSNRNQVSLTINGGLGMNFSDLLNSNRIAYSKKLLKELDNEVNTIEGIAYQSGFNSKASFYRAFKKFTSLTPTEYIESQKNQSQIT